MKPILLVFALAVSVSAAPVSSPRFEAYSRGSGDPAAMESMVKTLVVEDGNFVLDLKGNRLLVITTDENHEQIKGIVGQLSAPPANVKIDVAIRSASAGSSSEASVSGSGDIQFENGVTSSRIKLFPKLEHQSGTSSSDVNQMLVVSSGREASLHVGESVPYIDWLVDYGLQCGALVQRVAWQNVGSSLVVEPTVLADGMIRVRLTPELSGMVDGQPMRTRFATVATEVYVRDGETISLGGLDQNRDFYSKFLIGLSRGGMQESLSITLTPRVMQPGSAQ